MSGTVRVHIDELVLIGVRPGDRDAVAAALQAELARLLRRSPRPGGARGEPLRFDQLAAPAARLPARADARSVGRLAATQIHSSLRSAR
jgi:hypothetical protein